MLELVAVATTAILLSGLMIIVIVAVAIGLAIIKWIW